MYQPSEVLYVPPLFGLSIDQVAERRKYLGATDAKKIMDGNWLELWQDKKGITPPIAKTLPMLIGTHLEGLHRYWFGVETDYAVGYDPEDPLLVHPSIDYLACHIDGMLIGNQDDDEDIPLRPWEGKCTNPFTNMDKMVEYYYHQLQHIMLVTGSDDIEFSVIFLNNRMEHCTIEADMQWQETYIDQAGQFWEYIIDDVEPPNMNAVFEVPHEDRKVRRISLESNPQFVEAGKIWVANQAAAKDFDKAAKAVKQAVPEDALTAYSDEIYVTVGSNGAKTIRKLSEKKRAELDKEVALANGT